MKSMRVIFAAVGLLSLVAGQPARAVSGFWTANSGGNWSDTTKWTNTTPADGTGFTADFTAVNITAHRTVTLNTSRNIGQLRFGDRATADSDWNLAASGGSVLTMAVSSGLPGITVTNRTLTNACPMAGTQGLGKYGPGAMVMLSNNTFSGGFYLERGNVILNNSGALGVGPVTNNTFTNGTRFIVNGGVNITNALVLNTNNAGVGNGTITGPDTAGATGTWSGAITANFGAGAGGTFLGGSGVLRIEGPITAPPGVGLSSRNGVVIMAGGGSVDFLTIGQSSVVAGANDGIPTNAIMLVAASAAGTLNLNGFNQKLGGLTRGGFAGNVTNTTANPCTLTLSVPSTTNHTFIGPIGGAISLVKEGDGSHTLSANNNYSGSTTVSAGLLDMTGLYLGGGALTVNGGTLGVRADALVGPVTVNDGGTLAVTIPTAGITLATPALTNGSATAVTNTLNLGSGNPTAPAIYATNLAVTGTTYVNLTGIGLSIGQFVLVQYETAAGLTDSSFQAGTLPAGVLGYTSNNTANLSVDMVITQAPYLVWQGATNGVDTTAWDISTTTNWYDPFGAVTSVYQDGIAVRFDDTAPGTNVVVPSASVAPGGVTVANTNKDYTFSGSFPVAGAGRFTKEGSGTVTMGLTNTYSGDTVIDDGVFRLGANHVIPDGTGKGNVTVGGTLDVAGLTEGINGLSGGGVITNSSASAASLTIGNNNGAGTFGGVLSDQGSGDLSLTKAGSGAISLGSVQRLGGILTLGGGTLGLQSSLEHTNISRLTAASALDVGSGATVQLSSYTGGAFSLAKTGLGTLLLTNGTAVMGSLWPQQGTTILDNITVTNTAFLSVGRLTNDNGTLIVRGNAIISNTNADFNVGDVDNAIGRVFIRDNALLRLRGLWLGKYGTAQGYLYQTGGVVTNPYANAEWRFGGINAAATGTVGGLYMSGGRFDCRASVQIGAYGYGEMVISGGVFNSWINWPVVGRFAGGTGRLEVVGGTFNQLDAARNLIVGEAGTGWLAVSNGGLVVCTNTLKVGSVNVTTGTATVVLGAGGRIVAPGVGEHVQGPPISTFLFDGGVLQATTTNNPLYLQGLDDCRILDGGATIDSAGLNIAIAQPLLNGGAGGLTKSGLGTLTLSGANTYTGDTVVATGALRLSTAHAGGGAITVSDGTALGVDLATAGGSLGASSLTLGSSGASVLDLNLGVLGNPTVAVVNAATLTANGTATINFGGAVGTPAVYKLVDYSGAIGGGGFGAFALGSLPPGMSGELLSNGVDTSVDLNITNIAPLFWVGTNGTPWDINTTTNWDLAAAPVAYSDYAHVRFDDSAPGTTDVTLAGTVVPSSIIVSNETKNYLLAGAGKISGGVGVTKQGAATLTVSNANDYAGNTRLEGGVLRVGNAAALGASPGGTWTIDGGSLDLNGVSLNGRLNPVRIRGTGAGGIGAIYNSGGQQQNALRQLALDGDATIAAYGIATGAGRWDLRSPAFGDSIDLNGYTLTKVGTGYIGVAQFTIANSGAFSIQEGTLTFSRCLAQGPATVRIGPAGMLQFENYYTNEFDLGVESTGGVIWAKGNNFVLGSPVALVSGTTTVGVEGITLEATNLVSGAGGLIKQSSGTLRLAAANSFQGGVTLAAGTVRIEADSGLGDAAGGVTFSGASTLSVTNTFALSGTRPMAINAAATISVDTGSGLTINPGMTGTGGSLTKTGAGDLTLAGANIYAGDTTISAGNLFLTGGDDRLPAATYLRLADGIRVDLGGYKHTVASITGTVNTLTILATNGELSVQNPGAVALNSPWGGNRQIYDFSGLSRFGFTGAVLRIATGSTNNAPTTGEVYLARGTNVITSGFLGIGDGYAGGSQPSVALVGGLHLGETNEFNLDNTIVANLRAIGLIDFQAGLTAPGLRWRGTGGTDADTANVTVGQHSGGGGSRNDGRVLLTNGVLDARFGTLLVGFQSGANPTPSLGIFRMGAGLLLASNLVVGQSAANSPAGGAATGLVSLAGGTVQAQNFVVGEQASPNSMPMLAVFDLESGAVRAASLRAGAQVSGGATRRLNWWSGAIGNYDAATDLVVTNLELNLVAGGEHALDVDAGRYADVYSAMTNDGGLAKTGPGTARLFGTSTYSGATAVSNGTLLVMGALAGSGAVTVSPGATLGGVGSIAGAVTSDGTVSPGASIGTLAFQSSLTLNPGGATLMEIDTGASPSNDQAAVTGALTYGGTLVVTNLGGVLTTNDSFTLFTAGSFNGWFSSLILPALPDDLIWDTNKLRTTGILDVYFFGFSTQTLTTGKNTPAELSQSKLLSKASSSRGVVSLASVSASSAMTGSVSLVGTNIVYSPPTNYVGADSFTCVLEDGNNSITVTVDVTVTNTDNISGNILPLSLSGGNVQVRFMGIPGTNYVLQSATNLVTPPVTWLNRVTNTAPTNGLMIFLDTSATNIYLQYYRTLVP